MPLLPKSLHDSGHTGAKTVFEGMVRIENKGKEVQFLEYETNQSLAEAIGQKIIAEARSRFHLLDAACAHRIGKLKIGEIAIRVETLSAHRREGFEACEWIVDQVKRQVPIWKKEFFADGESEWSGSAFCEESELYSRQMCLSEIGEEGQERLKNSKVLVVGVGGLGCSAATYLVTAGIGQVMLIDPGLVEPSNLHRQPLFGVHDIGKPKVTVARDRLHTLNPFIEILTSQESVSKENVEELIAGYDVVLDCTDTFSSKFALNDACWKNDILLIHGALYQFEGQIMAIRRGWPCLRCLWNEEPKDGNFPTCQDSGILGPVAGIVGAYQALEAIQSICNIGNSPNLGNLFIYDLRNMKMQRVSVPCSTHCVICNPSFSSKTDDSDDKRSANNASLEIKLRTLADLANFCIIDVREPSELVSHPLPIRSNLDLPMSQFTLDQIPNHGKILFICAHGIRSLHIATALSEMGRTEVYSLAEGLDGLKFALS